MIDVIIPVYEGLEQTRRALESALATTDRASSEIVVVDDATPNPAIAAYLDQLAAAGRITLLRNAANQGFVRSVNRGMAAHPDRDVILLNSDTEVANDWVARLRNAATRAADVGTVTPFSNNATICSYPWHGWGGAVPGTLGLAALDRLFAQANAARTVDLPTAVGFCMYIRRACLERVGAFDAERFGRGYGEENDFCMRAGKAGWRNVLACDVFVYHEGAVSFSDKRQALMEAAAEALLQVHPEYNRVVREFIVADPVLAAREAVDAARAAAGAAEATALAAERARERQSILAELRATERALAEREAMVARLEAGLAEATRYVTERTAEAARLDEALRGRDAEIARLHEGLSHAESLAFGRQRELARIQSFWLWKYYARLMPEPEAAPQAER